ncbi:hypothetical protein GPECTOR_22g826 [Gonium pectorale]|uniref:ARMET C-terminal domain-containing protein n=1 Tax=Gonium pectorale TaxID=33097 RepID=A0A150GHC9_GONPE|nr:hypothetical protein GPECTOR_22g826 [Gonium pectorale]|eukprot:KXZ49234.1 hypothetical protein GPECTOR_22g826 [Gonium pectorale]
MSYANDLASWGLAVALYDLPEIVDDMVMVSTLGSILDTCTRDPRVSPHVDARAILLAGHSRGGKLSVLTAASDPRVKGLALLDPVDVTAMTPMGPGYPSALPAMRIACGPPRRMPALVVGAARNTDVIPADANYKRFVSSCPGMCWSLELQGAGHLQFLDSRVELLSMFVESGPVPDEVVRTASKAALLAWALELAVPLARGEAVSAQQVQDQLQQTTEVIKRLTPVASAIKGFEQLGGSTPRSASASTGSATGAVRSTPGSGQREGGGPQDASASSGAGASQSAAAGSAAGGSSAGSTSHAAGSGGSATGSQRSSVWKYDELMTKRAKELKAILVERGVDCSDCFEKADLAKRIMERC